jgi:drug/metabolite transporter superfamily protein YnfA
MLCINSSKWIDWSQFGFNSTRIEIRGYSGSNRMNSVGVQHRNLFQQVCILADCGFNHRASFKIHRFGFVHSTDWNPWLLFSNRMNSVREQHQNLFQQVWFLTDCGFNHRASFIIHRFGFVHTTDWNPCLLFSNRMNSVREQHLNLFQQVWFLTDCGFNHRRHSWFIVSGLYTSRIEIRVCYFQTEWIRLGATPKPVSTGLIPHRLWLKPQASFKIHRFGFVHTTDWNPWLLFSNRMNSVRGNTKTCFNRFVSWQTVVLTTGHQSWFIVSGLYTPRIEIRGCYFQTEWIRLAAFIGALQLL